MARRGVLIAAAAGLLVAGAATLGVSHYRARQAQIAHVHALTGGDPQAGRTAVERRACGSCHAIPNVPDAEGRVGPPLNHFAKRVFIGGHVPNTPGQLVRWIENPHAIDPGNAMPPMGIGEAEARDIAAYLYTLD